MDEAQWLVFERPYNMLFSLQSLGNFDRKLRLFAVACCRTVRHRLTDPRSQAAVDVAERFADGQATALEMTAAMTQARHAALATTRDHNRNPARNVVTADAWTAAKNTSESSARYLADDAARNVREGARTARQIAFDVALFAQANCLRDIIGNPFRPVAIPPQWRTSTVLAVAQGAYDCRREDFTLDPERLAILSDALEDAGAGQGLLDDLRFCRSRYRGYWVVDLVLEK